MQLEVLEHFLVVHHSPQRGLAKALIVVQHITRSDAVSTVNGHDTNSGYVFHIPSLSLLRYIGSFNVDCIFALKVLCEAHRGAKRSSRRWWYCTCLRMFSAYR